MQLVDIMSTSRWRNKGWIEMGTAVARRLFSGADNRMLYVPIYFEGNRCL